MQIYVCVKHVPDTAANIKVIDGTGFDDSVKFIVNPYDEYGVEEALRIKADAGEGEVVIVTVGPEDAASTMRSALAMGADRGILVTTEDQFTDSAVVAKALKAAIEQDGSPHIIFTGKQSVDSEGGQTHYRLAEAISIPVVSEVVGLSLNGQSATIEMDLGGGSRDIFGVQLPCVIGANKGLNEPRYPKMPDILKAKRKPIKQIQLSDLGIDADQELASLAALKEVPERTNARMLEGNIQEQVEKLVQILKEEDKVL